MTTLLSFWKLFAFPFLDCLVVRLRLVLQTAARALSSLPSTESPAKLQRSLMEQLLAIAWCLCEESSRAVTRFTEASLMRCVLEFLDYQRIDESLCLTAGRPFPDRSYDGFELISVKLIMFAH